MNGDGGLDLFERGVAHMALSDDRYDSDDDYDDYDDYEEDEYEEEDYNNDGFVLGGNYINDISGKINPDDYPNKRRYEAAWYLELVGDQEEDPFVSRCHFILEHGDEIVAANYMTMTAGFIYAQAIKDHFELQVTLPDEDEFSEYLLEEIIDKIHQKNVRQALDAWRWCVDQFLPYVEADEEFERSELTDMLVDNVFCEWSEEDMKEFAGYLEEYPDFRKKLIKEAANITDFYFECIARMLEFGFMDTALTMFSEILEACGGNRKVVNEMVGAILDDIEFCKQIEVFDFFEKNFIPKLKACSDGRIQDKIEKWEETIVEFKKWA